MQVLGLNLTIMEADMPLNELLVKAVKLWPEKEAISCGNVKMDYKTFGKRVFSLCTALKKLGLKRDDRLAIFHENHHNFLEAYFAAAHLGIILVPINTRLSINELSLIIEDSGASIIISQGKFKKIIKQLSDRTRIKEIIWTGLPEKDDGLYYEKLLEESDAIIPSIHIKDSDIAQIYYTSGTTGRPKGVILTHKNVKTHALGAIAELHLTDKDNWLHAAPMFHLADAWASFAITWAGGKHVFIPVFEASSVFRIIEKEKITITNLIPTMLNMMVNHSDVKKYNYSNLRTLMSGGAPIAPELVKQITDIFQCNYIQTYGMTETSPYLTLSILKEHLKSLPREKQLRYKAKTGREFITVNLKIIDEKGHDVKKDESQVGEIIVKGDTISPGYWNLPDETKKTIKDGWLYTGDLAVMDEEGYVQIVDRKKDMIITGGENVYSTEVENVLYMHPAILEASVIGVPDKHWGESVKAVVVVKEGYSATEKELIDFCKNHLAHYKAPKSVDFTISLPKTGSGKICKKELRERYCKKSGE